MVFTFCILCKKPISSEDNKIFIKAKDCKGFVHTSCLYLVLQEENNVEGINTGCPKCSL